MPEKNENLKELFSTFLNDAEAAEAADDVTQGLRILEQLEAPEPGEEVLAQINRDIVSKLASRPTSGVRWVRRSAVAAAAMVVIGLAAAIFWNPDAEFKDPGPLWWEGKPLVTMNAEMDELRERMILISREEYSFEDTVSDFDLAELEELEIVASNDDFWKD